MQPVQLPELSLPPLHVLHDLVDDVSIGRGGISAFCCQGKAHCAAPVLLVAGPWAWGGERRMGTTQRTIFCCSGVLEEVLQNPPKQWSLRLAIASLGVKKGHVSAASRVHLVIKPPLALSMVGSQKRLPEAV